MIAYPHTTRVASLFIVFALSAAALSRDEVGAQMHFIGVTAEVSCPGPLTCPTDAGGIVSCEVSALNRDPDHGLSGLNFTVDLPLGEGLRIVPSGCATALAAGDGIAGGSDTTSCTFSFEFDVDFCLALTTTIVEVHASGFDADPLPLPQGFGGLPAEGSVSTALEIDVLPHSVRLSTALDCERAGVGPASCRLTVENEDLYHATTSIVFTKQVAFPKGPIRTIEPGCATSLARGDGVPGVGPDFTSCTFDEPLEQVCDDQLDGAQIQVVANGREDVESGFATGGAATAGVVRAFSCGAGHLAALATEISCISVVSESSPATCTIFVENRDADHGVEGLTVHREIPLPDGTLAEVTGCAGSLRPNDGVDGSGSDSTFCTTQFSLADSRVGCEGPYVNVGIAAVASGKDADPNPLDRGGCGGLDVAHRESTSVLFLCGAP